MLARKFEVLTNGRESHFFTIALEVTVILKGALARAEEISLEAMNANSVVARAGEKAQAIRPIVDRAEELSRSIIQLVNQINAQSTDITRSSLSEFMEEVTVGYFERAQTLGEESKHIASLDPVVTAANDHLGELRKTVADQVRGLSRLLDEINSLLLATSIVTSKFRLEAGVSDSAYRANLESIVEKFDNAVAGIRAFTLESKKTLATNKRKFD